VKYLLLDRSERKALLSRLEAMPDFLTARFASLAVVDAAVRGPNDTLSPVEQCWHLADLEREGFGVRIQRLLEEEDPFLPDFDGARIAKEREYRSRNIPAALAAFRVARDANLALLRSLEADQWSRGGRQEGVGPVALCDLPQLMAEHDAGHRAEIDEWSQRQEK